MIAKGNLRFNVGDWVVHFYHGIGRVKGIVEKGINGNKIIYYEVKTNNFTYWIPIKDQDSDHIKPIRSKIKFENALILMRKTPEQISQFYKARKKQIHERWLKGDLSSRAKLLRDINGRENRSFNEKDILEKIKQTFINEWIISDETMTRAQANIRIKTALKESVRKSRVLKNTEK